MLNPNGDLLFAVVPVNDHRTRFYHVWWDENRPIGEEPLRSDQLKFVGLDPQTLAGYGMTDETYDAPGAPSRSNRYLQDREAVRSRRHFTGLPSFSQEDAAVSISAGPIRDRTKEMLSIADVGIGRLYQVLLKCARLAQAGADPVGVNLPDVGRVVGLERTVPDNTPWQSLVPHHRRSSQAPRLRAAALDASRMS